MIVNLQRRIKISAADFMPFFVAVRAAVEEIGKRNFSVAFVSDKRMLELNKVFRDKDVTTDVLSFPHEQDEFEAAHLSATDDDEPHHESIGDIVISVEQAAKQADENGLTLDLEIKQLILHGVLHLCGYDHETDSGEMNARELELRDKLGVS
jgi:probable rRNA maturation factor